METDKLMELLLKKFEEQKIEQEERDRRQREEQEERDRRQEERDRKQREEQEERDRKQREEQEERERKQREEQEERDRKQREEQEERDRKQREEQEERDRKQEDLIRDLKAELLSKHDEQKRRQEEQEQRHEELLKSLKEDLKKEQEDFRKEQEELREGLQIKLTEVETSVAAVRAEMQEEIKALEIKVRKAHHPEPGVPSIMKVKPPKFDGKVAWNTYLNQFEAAARGNCWDDEEKAINLKLCLRGEPTEILRMVPTEQQFNALSYVLWK